MKDSGRAKTKLNRLFNLNLSYGSYVSKTFEPRLPPEVRASKFNKGSRVEGSSQRVQLSCRGLLIS